MSIACTPQAPTPQQHVETWRWNWDPDRVVALKGALGSMQLLPPAEEIPQLSMSDLWSHWHHSLTNTAYLYCTNFAPRCKHQSRPGRRPWMTHSFFAALNSSISSSVMISISELKGAETWIAFVTQRNRTTTQLREAKSAFVSAPARGDVTGAQERNLYKLMTSLRSSPFKHPPPTVVDMEIQSHV